jgi:DNA-binding CsgD family transcriptional regulator/tetratricopeptide (TPR) repeat protein
MVRRGAQTRPSRPPEEARGAALLERGPILEELRQIVDRAGTGQGSLILLSGEAGVGKTSLSAALLDSLGSDRRTATGHCLPLSTAAPLGAMYGIAEALGPSVSDRLADGSSPFLVARAVLDELAGTPTVVLIEDLHFADEATLDVVRVLSRGVEATPSVVLATYRVDGLRAGPLRPTLGELGGRPCRLRLEPISAEAVAELAGGSGIDPTELWRRTGGNPFFVTEVLASPRQRVPDSIRDAVLARLSRLGDRAGALAEAIAVIPGEAEMRLLETIAAAEIDELDDCLASGMVVAGRGGVGFRHELARLAVAEATPYDRSLTLHRAVLAALGDPSRGEPDPSRLSHHAAAAGDAAALRLWAPRAAAQAAASGSHREAVAHYREALEAGPEEEARAELLERLGGERFLTNEYDQAVRDLREALEIARRRDEPLRVGRVLCLLAGVAYLSGRTGEADGLAVEAVEILEPAGRGRELAAAYATRALMRMLVGDLRETRTWAGRAIEMAESLGDQETLAHALNSLGTAVLEAGEPGGREVLERALAMARAAELPGEAARALNNLVSGSITTREYALAERYMDEAVGHCADHGLELWQRPLLADRATLALERGRWDAAARSAEELLDDQGCPPLVRLAALVVRAAVGLRRGGAETEPTEILAEALGLAEAEGTWWAMSLVAPILCESAWLAGDGGDAEEVTRGAAELLRGSDDAWALGDLALWRRRLGVREPSPEGVADPYRLSLAGDWRGAADAWTEIGVPYQAALALTDADEEAPRLEAHRRLREIGAESAAEGLARRLRAEGIGGLARGPRPRTRGNPAGLTPRELEVARLLAEGSRNAQIADRLVISAKTVDHHVSSVLAKLGVHDRRAAAAELVRLGALTQDR